MGIARSTFYDKPAAQDDTAIVAAISGICEEFEFYGWRRVRAELRHRGLTVNHKKVRRLMREHDLQPRRVEGLSKRDWILMDYLDVVVHIFTPEMRADAVDKLKRYRV